jgi:hypothetical protein
MSTINRGPLGSAFLIGREPTPAATSEPQTTLSTPPRVSMLSNELIRSIAEVKGQAQFLLYLADQIEDSLHQLVEEHDDSQNAFLCRVLGMYSAQLESKHQGLGDRIAETCQEVYVTVREFDSA